MGGCWGYKGRIGKKTNSQGEQVDEYGPLDDLSYCDGRKVYLLPDANVATNKMVKKAESNLIRELKKRDCEVRICRLPQMNGVNGPEDYLSIATDEEMLAVFNCATARHLTHDYAGGHFELSEDRGVEFIGPPDKEGNPRPAIWLCAPLEVRALTRDDRSREWGRLLQ